VAGSDDNLRVRIRPHVSHPTLVLGGEVDAESGAKLRTAIDRAMADRATSLDFDFSNVSFMDSTGLRALAYANERTAEAGGSVRVLGASPTVVRLLSVTGLDAVIEVVAP